MFLRPRKEREQNWNTCTYIQPSHRRPLPQPEVTAHQHVGVEEVQAFFPPWQTLRRFFVHQSHENTQQHRTYLITVVTGKFTEHVLGASHGASHTLDHLILTTTLVARALLQPLDRGENRFRKGWTHATEWEHRDLSLGPSKPKLSTSHLSAHSLLHPDSCQQSVVTPLTLLFTSSSPSAAVLLITHLF